MFKLLPWRRKETKVPVTVEEEFFRPLARLRDELDRLVDRFFGKLPAAEEESERWGNVELTETDKEYVVKLDVPGFEPEEFDVQLSGNRLIVRAEKKAEKKKEEKGRAYQEVSYRSFHRLVTLPNVIDPQRVEAKYHSGVLEVHVGKKPGAAGRKVPVKAS
ncbi:MAG: Hsp20/alpha crystallin family protein [Gemmatales bacterium]|nr:Hsp20/alpha crystallin family protein [Gemmatales bacterium]MCS7161148.1 Hsp20/alpha crystallin family protein [Gemmatales bacterium]MDW8176351.1 Hsp20/alpha crystallin family protein [Gemmatales bacterium]MDW8221705.1 Hsp20/alpha crystallin family protein [Gemmatales bacterium]